MSNEIEDRHPYFATFMNDRPPDTLFHYTSAQGLMGILKRRVMWASDCFFMNDKKELKQSADVFREICRSWETKFQDPEYSKNLVELMKVVDEWSELSTLTVSFSEKGDLLSQWRAYCPSEGGYSIGFERNFKKHLRGPFSTGLFKCLYDKENQIKAFTDVVNPASKLGVIDATTFEFHYRTLRACMKHVSFSEEKEWRIVSMDPTNIIPNLLYRARNNLIVPFYELPFLNETLPISEIIIGPGLNPELAKIGLYQILDSLGQTHIEIKQSQVTLR